MALSVIPTSQKELGAETQQIIVGSGLIENQLPTEHEFIAAMRSAVSLTLLLEALYRRAAPVVEEKQTEVQSARDYFIRHNDSYLDFYGKQFFGDAPDEDAEDFLNFVRNPVLTEANFPEPEKTAPSLALSEDSISIDRWPREEWKKWFEYFSELGADKAIVPGEGVFKEREYLAFIVRAASNKEVVVLFRPRLDEEHDAVYLYGYGEGWEAQKNWEQAASAGTKRDARNAEFPLLAVKYRSKHVRRNLKHFLKNI